VKKIFIIGLLLGLLGPNIVQGYVVGNDNNNLSTHTKVIGEPILGVRQTDGRWTYLQTYSTGAYLPAQERGGILKVFLMGLNGAIASTVAVNGSGEIKTRDDQNLIEVASIDSRLDNVISTNSEVQTGNFVRVAITTTTDAYILNANTKDKSYEIYMSSLTYGASSSSVCWTANATSFEVRVEGSGLVTMTGNFIDGTVWADSTREIEVNLDPPITNINIVATIPNGTTAHFLIGGLK